uniref:hypothetical protein n=1 Tax=Serratia liquefaciens TaxID=614 RepID=UPI00356B77A1
MPGHLLTLPNGICALLGNQTGLRVINQVIGLLVELQQCILSEGQILALSLLLVNAKSISSNISQRC